MDILKYKKLKNGKYELSFSDADSMILYEEVILKFQLLLTKKIENEKELLAYNEECDTYYVALKYLKSRAHSKKEVFDYLKKKEYPIEYIEKVVLKLEEQGYINDFSFARSFLNNKMITTSHGPLSIKKDLLDKGVSANVIDEVLVDFTDELQQEKIDKQVSRMIKSNRNKGNRLLLQKIMHDLTMEGFDKKLINESLSSVELEDDSLLAKKEYDKLYKKYSKKYSGAELEYKISQKLYQKGFHYEKN